MRLTDEQRYLACQLSLRVQFAIFCSLARASTGTVKTEKFYFAFIYPLWKNQPCCSCDEKSDKDLENRLTFGDSW